MRVLFQQLGLVLCMGRTRAGSDPRSRYVRHIRAAMICSSAHTVAMDLAVVVTDDFRTRSAPEVEACCPWKSLSLMGEAQPQAWQRHAAVHTRRGIGPLPLLEPERCPPCPRDPPLSSPASRLPAMRFRPCLYVGSVVSKGL
jgi:hypothetical protein